MPSLVPTLVTVRPPPGIVTPEWVERTLIFRLPTLRVVAVDGWVYGTLAVHSTWDDPDLPPVTITHLPSKLAVARMMEPQEAAAQVEWLWQAWPGGWGEEPDIGRVPKEVAEWCRSRQR